MKDKKMFYLASANLLTSVGTGLTTFLIPWLILKQNHGDQLFTISFILITLSMFLLTPYIGSLIDTYSRKRIILFLELSGLLLISLTFGVSVATGKINIVFLLLILFSQSLYDSIKYSTISAWTQNIFEKSQYSKLNGMLEVQGQVALMLSAGLTALLVGKVQIQYILLFDMFTYASALFLYSKLPDGTLESSTNSIKSTERKGSLKKTMEDFMYSLSFIKENKRLFVFLFITTLPSIIILVGNYLNPIFLYNYLDELPSIQGVSSVIFAVGATLGGIIPVIMLKKLNIISAIKITNILFLISFLLIAVFPFTAVFLSSRILSGVSNSSIRVLRKDILFVSIPNHLIGRINTIFNSFSLLIRVLLVSTFGIVISEGNVLYGYYIICAVLILSIVVLSAYSMKNMKPYLMDEELQDDQEQSKKAN